MTDQSRYKDPHPAYMNIALWVSYAIIAGYIAVVPYHVIRDSWGLVEELIEIFK